jgi:ABC-type nitrate/sulfonate/bicarbonate transport system substrate-binding protein
MLKTILRRALPCALLALTALTGPAQAQNPPLKTRLVLPAVSVLFAPVYIAQDAGYFKDAGLEVEMGLLAGPAALNGLIGGSADFTAIAGLIQLRAAQRGQKTLAIAGLQENATTEIVLAAPVAEKLASARTAVERARALKGLTLAVDAANGLPHAYLRYVARQAGIDADRDIRLVFIAPTGMDAALQKKEIDGFVFSSPFSLEAVKRGARLWISGPGGDFPQLNPTTYNVLVARDGYCGSTPAACRAMVAALERGMRLIATEPAKALALLGKRFEKMDPDLLKQAFESFQRNTPPKPQPMGKAFEHTVETLASPADDKAALRELAKSLHTDEFLATPR